VADRLLQVSLTQAAPVTLDVAFQCAPGEVLGIFGPSGSGKTTILRAIAGLHAPSAGRVSVGGESWLDTARGLYVPVHRRAVGFVFQEYALFPHLTALGNVLAALGHRPRHARRQRAEELLDLVHLDAQRHRRPAELSGGERQRVAVARALARDPAVLLLDEPFSAVDRLVRRRLQEEIDDLRRSLDIPLVLVTHDFDDIVRLATHLLVLREGRAAAAGPIEDVTSRPEAGWLGETVGLGAVFDAEVARTDPSRGLAELAFAGGTLIAPDQSLAEGTRVRVRVPARDVILASQAPAGLSLHNVLDGSVSAVRHSPGRPEVVVQLAVGRIHLLAAVTRDAVERLRITEGTRLHALVKSVSLDVLATRPASARTEGDSGPGS
jgi:molybdate transport system ATP-binding protein